MKKTRITELLGVEYPILQAPMCWLTSAELVASVSNAGGFGVLGPNAGQHTVTEDPGETATRLREQIRKVRSLTDKPFGVNFVILPDDVECNLDLKSASFCSACADVIISERVPAVVIAGFFSEGYIEAFRKAGILTLCRDVNPNRETSQRLEKAGADAIIAVGFDAGGHLSEHLMPTISLIPYIVDAVKIPVVAGGGIVDGRGVAAAMVLGAEGVYIGTKFIAAVENPAHQLCKEAIINTDGTRTVAYRDEMGLMSRLLPSEKMRNEIQNDPSKTYMDLLAGGLKDGMLDGDIENAIVTVSTACGLIDEVQSCEAIMNDLVSSATQTIRNLQ